MTSENTSCRMSIPYSEGMRKCGSRIACDYAYPFGGEKFCALEWSYRVPEDISIRRNDDLETHIDYILNSQESRRVEKLDEMPDCETTNRVEPASGKMLQHQEANSEQELLFHPDTKLGSCRQPIPLDLPLKDKLEDLEDRRHPPIM